MFYVGIKNNFAEKKPSYLVKLINIKTARWLWPILDFESESLSEEKFYIRIKGNI